MQNVFIPSKKVLIWGLFFASGLSGALSAFAMAPYHVWGLLLVGLGVLFVIQNKVSKPYQAFITCWLFGFFYFLFSLSWIGNALLVDGNPYKWAWPLAVSGLPFILSFFPALAGYIAKKLFSYSPAHHFIGFVILLSLFEWLRGHVFTGFPWNLYGYAWGNMLEMLQILHFSDAYFLTALTIFWGASLGFIYIEWANRKNVLLVALITTFSLLSVYAYGYNRLNTSETRFNNNITVRLVQPNIDQAAKWEREKMTGHFENMVELSMADGSENQTTFIIWPETATNYLFLENEFSLSQIRDALSTYSNDAYLITGAFLRDDDGLPSNSLIVLDKNGEIITRYNKSHLVPFGEYIPFQQYIPLKSVTGFSGFKQGEGRETMQIEDFSFSPLICYEILFPGNVINYSKSPDAIINVTNDGWYGDSAGPHQHLLKARFRAIEEGIPVIRSANTGISAIIDPYGRYMKHLNLMEYGNATQSIPIKIGAH